MIEISLNITKALQNSSVAQEQGCSPIRGYMGMYNPNGLIFFYPFWSEIG